MHKSGVENVVSSSGTSLTESQVNLIKRHTSNITVLFDGDAAGTRASLRGIDIILAQGMHVKTVMFPEGEDPDSYSRKLGALGFKRHLEEHSIDFIQFKTKILLEGKESDPVAKAETIGQVVASIALVPDQVLRTLYLKSTSDQLGIEEDVLYAELNKHLLGAKRPETGQTSPTTVDTLEEVIRTEKRKSVDSVELQERESIRLLINYGFNKLEDSFHLCDHYLEELADIEFSNSVYNEILQMFKSELSRGKVIDAEFLINNSPDHIREEVIGIVSNKHELSENWDKRYRIYVPKEEEILHDSVYTNILRLKFYKVKKLIELHLKQIRSADSEEKQAELIRVYMELKKAEGAFAKPLGIVVSG
jgi:DNA primase